MTVVVAVKVFDGIVLAADSATSLPLFAPGTPESGGPPTLSGFQVYNNADKIFHLHRDLPIGLATWGAGQIDSASISTLAKDLRRRLMGLDPLHLAWRLNPAEYTIEEVAGRLVDLMYRELYSKSAPDTAQVIGFLLAGYSSGARHPEAWQILFEEPETEPVPDKFWDLKDEGWRANGQPQAIARLFNGHDPDLLPAVLASRAPDVQAEIQASFDGVARQVVVAPMPFADAIDIARFCVDLTIGYTRFIPGSDLVGGPVDVAGISRHEGFKWVQRKHYYSPELNPRRPHDHDL
ncbi:MAG TPA: hypothetical protein VNV87_01805 [Acidimicrobiales bacterium]|nr:hypothetical protein [Acidimicrobiales bacterium]